MPIKLSVERLKSELTNVASKSLAHIDPAVLEEHGLEVGAVIKISTDFTRHPIPARIGECYEEDRGRGTIHLDRF